MSGSARIVLIDYHGGIVDDFSNEEFGINCGFKNIVNINNEFYFLEFNSNIGNNYGDGFLLTKDFKLFIRDTLCIWRDNTTGCHYYNIVDLKCYIDRIEKML